MSIIINDGNSKPVNVTEFIIKHESHNQASHAGSRGGAGPSKDNELAEGGVNFSVSSHRREAKQLEADVKADGGSSALGDITNSHQAISAERGPLTTKMASPQEMRASLKESATSLQSAGKKLTSEGKDSLATTANALAQKIINTHNNIGNY